MRQLVLYQGGIFFKVEDFCFHTIQSPIWPSQRILCKCLMHIALTMFWLHGSRYWLNPLHLLSLSKTKIVFAVQDHGLDAWRWMQRFTALNAKIHGTECTECQKAYIFILTVSACSVSGVETRVGVSLGAPVSVSFQINFKLWLFCFIDRWVPSPERQTSPLLHIYSCD